MKQKLALSCTLIHTPKILVLDEPTTGVDPVSRREFWEILKNLRREGVTILVTTPYMDEAAKCDRVAFINKGHILLAAAPGRIPQLYKGKLVEVRCRENVAGARALRGSGHFAAVQVFGDRIHVSASGEAEMLQRAVRVCLDQAGIAIDSIEPIEAGIEDVFVDLLK